MTNEKMRIDDTWVSLMANNNEVQSTYFVLRKSSSFSMPNTYCRVTGFNARFVKMRDRDEVVFALQCVVLCSCSSDENASPRQNSVSHARGGSGLKMRLTHSNSFRF